MARLQDLRPSFTVLSWVDKITFVEEYRTKRYNDINTVQEFDLSKKQKKTKSTTVREKKEPSVKKVSKKQMLDLSPEQLSLLKQLGVC